MTCPKCNGKKLLPFEKNGRIIPHAFVNCDCYEEEPEHYHEVRPEDIDYPISYDHYRSLCQLHGWTDPGHQYPPEPKETVVRKYIYSYEYEHTNIQKGQWDRINQAILNIGHLQKQIQELTTARIKKKGYIKYE